MAYNKPIVSTTKIVDDPCLPYLKQYGNAVLLDESKPIENGGIKLQDFVRERNTEGKETVNVFDLAQPGGALYANTPAAFASYLDQINQKAE